MVCDPAYQQRNRGIYTVKVQGTVCHIIPELVPENGHARQLQLFFYGTENKIDNRLSQTTTSRFPEASNLDKAVVTKIMAIMESNPYAAIFRSLRELPTIENHNIVLRSDSCLDQGIYNLPTTDHVAAIWHQLADKPSTRAHDIHVYTHSEETHYIQYYY